MKDTIKIIYSVVIIIQQNDNKGMPITALLLKKKVKKKRFFELLSKAKMKMVVSESTFLFLEKNEQKVKYQLMHNF